MPLCKRLELSHSIEIKTTPEKILNFLKNPENYTIWHPQDHIKVIWTEGKPFEVGSKFYSEQRVFGKVQKYNAKIQEIIPNRKIVFTCQIALRVPLISAHYVRSNGWHVRLPLVGSTHNAQAT